MIFVRLILQLHRRIS